MTNAFGKTVDSRNARAAGAEIWFALVTAGSLLAMVFGAPASGLGFSVASCFGLASAVSVARIARPMSWTSDGMEAVWSGARLWVALATANLAMSPWANDRLTLAGLWLPCLTAATLHCFRESDCAVEQSVATGEPNKSKVELPRDEAVAVDQGDRLHCVEWTQSHDSKGLKCVAGVARLTFRPGERQTELHLAFCPSFASPPEFDCHQAGGPDVRIKVTQTMPYGARIEVQRAEPSAWGVVSLEFTASSPYEQQAAAPMRRAS